MKPTVPVRSEDPLERARRHLEARLFEALSLSQLAAVAGLSTYHFARQFSARFGESPMAYVRARRLAIAAARLSATDPPSLIDLAFDCRFDSQEAFTRAFARTFGAPPGRYRRLSNPTQELPMSRHAPKTPTLSDPSGPTRKPGLRLAGLPAQFRESEMAEIPQLWARLFATWPDLAHTPRRTFGVNEAGADAEELCLAYTAAAELRQGEPLPVGLVEVLIPARSYLVWRQVMDGSDLHPQMQAGMKEIWGVRAPATGRSLARAPDLEVYPEGFRPDLPGAWMEWWLPIED